MKVSKPQSVTGVLEYDPELRFTPGGHAVATFVLIDHATGEKTSCEMWRDKAEDFIEQFFAGQRMAILTVWGASKTRTWRDRNEQPRETVTFTVTRHEFVSVVTE